MPNYLFEINKINSIVHRHSEQNMVDISIVKFEEDSRPPEFFFTSKHLDDLVEPREIWAKGLYLLSLYKGAYHIFSYDPHDPYDLQNNLTLSRLYPWENNRNITPANPHLISPEDPFTPDKINAPLLPFECPEADPIANSIHKSKSEKQIRNILLQFGSGIDWINLFAILDSLKTYSSNDKFSQIISKCGITPDDVKSFTGMANNFGLLGVAARHGDLNWEPPKRKVSINESRALLIKITRKFLELEFGITIRP